MNKHWKISVQWLKQIKVNDTIDIQDDTIDTIDTNDIIIDTERNQKLNRTLKVGTTFWGKTHLLLNKLQLKTLKNK